jgi:hypothetical protein
MPTKSILEELANSLRVEIPKNGTCEEIIEALGELGDKLGVEQPSTAEGAPE